MVAKEEFFKESSEKPVKNIDLSSIRSDWYQSEEKITFVLYVKNTIKEFTKIDYHDQSCSICFKTNDKLFLDQHHSEPSNLFVMNIELNDLILPEKCSFKSSNSSIEINLFKKCHKKWQNLLKVDLIEQTTTKKVQNRSASSSRSPSPQPNSRSMPISNYYGYTGLANLGNTCYMNAAIQFLANATDLRDYFFNKEIFQKELNLNNALGLNGKMAIQFAMLLRRLWKADSNYLIPNQLRELICSKYSNFRGYEQQDTQEFMSSLLSLIHEDLNRVVKKPFYEDSLECENDSLDECLKVAAKSWERFLSRENSVIVDNFYGQFKSKLTCPECDRSSITFEPFNNLLVPVPKAKKQLNFFTITENQVLFSEWFQSEDDTVESFTQGIRSASKLYQNKDLRVYVIEKCNETDEEESIGFKFDSYYDNLQPHDRMPILGKNKNILLLVREWTNDDCIEIKIEQACKYPISNVVDAKKCSFCSKQSESEIVLPRCTRCFRSAYCNSECQKNDWKTHNTAVCKIPSDRVGLPYVLFLSQKELKSDNFASIFKEACIKQALKSIKLDNFDLNKNSIYDLEILDTSSTSITPNYKKLDPEKVSEFLINSKNLVKIILKWNNSVSNRSVRSSFDFPNDCQLQYNFNIELNDCLRLFTQPEKLTSDNPWYCSRCKKHQEATKQMSLWKLPKYLIITLKRFQAKKMYETPNEFMMNSRLSYLFQNRVIYNKIDELVNFPLCNLNMTEFLVNGDKRNFVYDLCGVINHLGSSLSVGHYTAFARTHDKADTTKNELGWRLFDDQNVMPVKSVNQLTSKNAYVLMYRLRSAQTGKAVYDDKSDAEISSESANEEEFYDIESEESIQMEKINYTNLNEID